MKAAGIIKKTAGYVLLSAAGIIMLYPMLWLVGASFKSNDEIFSSAWFIPHDLELSVYVRAWRTVTPYTMGHYFLNTFGIIIPRMVFSVFSSVLTAYGFARFEFPLKRFFFSLLMCSMFMPAIVKIMPMYMLWGRRGLLDSYIPLTLPALLAGEGSFVLMIIQFLRGVPKEFDEAARIDGCNTIQVLFYILIPCIKPVIATICIFTFLWTMNEFIEPLIMISSVRKYPLSLILRLSADSTGDGYEQRKIIAMSVIGLIPSIAVFAAAQRKFVSGITSGGLTG